MLMGTWRVYDNLHRFRILVGLIHFVGLNLNSIGCSVPPPRAALDEIWEKNMLEGKFAFVEIVNSKIIISEKDTPVSSDPNDEEPSFGVLMRYPISVRRLGEGLFGNGGWILGGGLLRRIKDGPSTIEFYGKHVVRQFPHFRILFHRDPPMEVGYEFFLLNRSTGILGTSIIRKWIFQPENVIQKNPNYPAVTAVFRYEKSTFSATLTITGLKRPFEERIDLSSVK